MAAVSGLKALWRHHWVVTVKNHTTETLKQVSIEKCKVLPRHIPEYNEITIIDDKITK